LIQNPTLKSLFPHVKVSKFIKDNIATNDNVLDYKVV
jgi:hypothetical protein